MRITLRRKGQIKSFESILTIESLVSNRMDIVEMLQFIKRSGGIGNIEILQTVLGETVSNVIIEGIISHLKSIGMLNSNAYLSTKGNRVAETGLFPIEERGQFAVYYIEDEILTNFALHFERSRIQRREGFTKMDSILFVGKNYTSVIDSTNFRIKNFEIKNQNAYLSEMSGNYELVWEIDLNREMYSKFYISGEVRSVSNNILRYRHHELEGINNFDSEKLIYMLIEKHKYENSRWNDVTGCLEVPLENLKEDQYDNLEISMKIPSISINGLGDFESTDIYSIPIGPLNEQDAKTWVFLLAKKFLEHGYKSRQEIYGLLDELKQYPAFINYQGIIDTITVEELSEKLKNKNYSNSFWNIQAPLDLYVDIEQRFIVRNRRIDVASGKKLSMMEMVEEILHFDQPETLVFSSKFVKNPAQIKKFMLFVQSFRQKGLKEVLLITKETLKVNNNLIQVELYDDVFAGVIQPHDRYFAYKSDGEWHRFKMTAELDQCRYEHLIDADVHTRGVWQDISFIEVTPEIFPFKLNERLSRISEVHQP